MSKHTITMQLELDCKPTGYSRRDDLRTNTTYYLDIPRINMHQFNCVRVKVTIAKTKEEP